MRACHTPLTNKPMSDNARLVATNTYLSNQQLPINTVIKPVFDSPSSVSKKGRARGTNEFS